MKSVAGWGVLLFTGSAAAASAVWGCSSPTESVANRNSQTCPVGGERCPCTEGGACDPGLACRSHLCVHLSSSPGAGGTPGAGTTDGGSVGGTAGVAGTPAGSGSSQGLAGSGTAGGHSQLATCAFPKTVMFPTLGFNPANGSKPSITANFAAGTLVDLDGKACTLDTSGAVPTGDWGSYPCRDGFDCDGCLVFVIGEKGADKPGRWNLLGAHAATGGKTAGCPEYSGVYSTCVPDCSAPGCGQSDGCGHTCGCGGKGECCSKANTCVQDSCSQCISDCSDPSFPNASNCCTSGPGCVCAGACPGPC